METGYGWEMRSIISIKGDWKVALFLIRRNRICLLK
jgi:hypothetical protein